MRDALFNKVSFLEEDLLSALDSGARNIKFE
jgi:hypothetical protein